jgi:protein SCO1/2
MKNGKIANWIFVLTAIVFLIAGALISKNSKSISRLPFLGQCRYDTINRNGILFLDTIHHTVQNFSFTDQTGKTITEKDFKGKIYVADFFFTTCKSICPLMTTQLQRVIDAYKNEPSVLFLSHTVYPEHDSVSVLADYAERHHADPSRWHFVTGNKKELYTMARTSYLLSSDTGNGGGSDFVHTQKFALVDANRHVRGIYNGTDSTDVSKLITEIGFLLKDEQFNSENP